MACHKVRIERRIACQSCAGRRIGLSQRLYWAKNRCITKATRENTKGKNPQMYMASFWAGHGVTSVRNCVRQLTDWKRFLKCGIKAWIAVCVQRTVKCLHLIAT
jgi:hypothetical protein